MGSKTAVTDGQSTTFRAKVLCAERGDDSPAANFGKLRETVGRKAMGTKRLLTPRGQSPKHGFAAKNAGQPGRKISKPKETLGRKATGAKVSGFLRIAGQ